MGRKRPVGSRQSGRDALRREPLELVYIAIICCALTAMIAVGAYIGR
jgi:hypothetical protein